MCMSAWGWAGKSALNWGLEASFIKNVFLKGTGAEVNMTTVHTVHVGGRKVDKQGIGRFSSFTKRFMTP